MTPGHAVLPYFQGTPIFAVLWIVLNHKINCVVNLSRGVPNNEPRDSVKMFPQNNPCNYTLHYIVMSTFLCLSINKVICTCIIHMHTHVLHCSCPYKCMCLMVIILNPTVSYCLSALPCAIIIAFFMYYHRYKSCGAHWTN